MKLQVINIDGKKVDDIEISDQIFSLKPNKNVIQSLVDWQISHFKTRTAKTKQNIAFFILFLVAWMSTFFKILESGITKKNVRI